MPFAHYSLNLNTSLQWLTALINAVICLVADISRVVVTTAIVADAPTDTALAVSLLVDVVTNNQIACTMYAAGNL